MYDKRHLRLYELKQKIQYHPEIGTYVSEEDIDLMERIVVDETHLIHSEWIIENEHSIRCPICCFNRSSIKMPLNYCPNCGARMDGGK